jgi:thiosulfate reductase cytochrome b subunit
MERVYVHPLPVRVWHWVNATGFVAMILTGAQLRYVGIVDLISFETAVDLHNWIGFALIGNFFVWLGFYLFSDRIRVYHPELSPMKHFRDSFRQMQYYGYGIFKGDPNPHQVSVYDKFNPMQSMMYQVVMLFLVPLVFFTGLLLWDTVLFSGAVEFFGGLRVVDTVHVLIFIFFTFFVFLHVYLGSLGHTVTAHYKAMFLTGYEEIHEEHGSANPPH